MRMLTESFHLFSYPASVISVTLGQPSFLAYMGLLNAEGKVAGNFLNIEGATSGVFQAGSAVNTILTAIVLDKVRRRLSGNNMPCHRD